MIKKTYKTMTKGIEIPNYIRYTRNLERGDMYKERKKHFAAVARQRTGKGREEKRKRRILYEKAIIIPALRNQPSLDPAAHQRVRCGRDHGH